MLSLMTERCFVAAVSLESALLARGDPGMGGRGGGGFAELPSVAYAGNDWRKT